MAACMFLLFLACACILRMVCVKALYACSYACSYVCTTVLFLACALIIMGIGHGVYVKALCAMFICVYDDVLCVVDMHVMLKKRMWSCYVVLLRVQHMSACTRVSFFHFPKGNTASLTAWTTPVSNQLRSPRLRASVSDMIQKCAFALGIPSNI